MKIGYICPNYYPDMAGGIEWYTLHISEELVRLGHEVHVFTQQTENASEEDEVHNGVNIHRIKSYGFFYRAKYWPKLRETLVKYNLDALFSLDYAQTQTWTGQKYAKQNNITFAVLLYDIQSQKKPRAFIKQVFLDLYDKVFARIILNRVDKIFIRTKAVLPWLKELRINTDKVYETPCGLTNEELTPGNANDFYNKFKIKDNIILFLGRIRKQKGIFMLLDAFKNIKRNIPGAKLVYVGPDDKEYDKLEFSSEIMRRIEDENIKDVHLLGPLYGQDKNDAIAACDLLTLPSSYEAFGQVYTQTMAQGKPTIGTNAGGAPFVIDHDVNGYIIEPWDQQALEQYLTKLLENKNLRDKLGQEGIKKAQLYRYSELAKKFIEHLRR